MNEHTSEAPLPHVKFFRRAFLLPVLLPLPAAIVVFFVGSSQRFFDLAVVLFGAWTFLLLPYLLFAAFAYWFIGRNSIARVRVLLWLGPCICVALLALGVLILSKIEGPKSGWDGWWSDPTFFLVQAPACGYASVMLIEFWWRLDCWKSADDKSEPRRMLVRRA